MTTDATAAAVAAEPVTVLQGVGPALAEKLARLSVVQVQDLLFLLPLRYEDRSRLRPLGSLRAGERVAVEGVVELTEAVIRRRRQMLCTLSDGTGTLLLRFFHFSRAQQQGLARGTHVRCFGEVRKGPSGLEMVHPEYRRIAEGDAAPAEESLTPVYPTTEGIQQGRIRHLVTQARRHLDATPPADWLPEDVCRELGFPSLVDAIHFVHAPPADTDMAALEEGRHPAQRRLAFEELLAHQLSLRLLRRAVRREAAPVLTEGLPLSRRFREGLPFELTAAQDRVLKEIAEDLDQPHPMLRLVQGDVGSGKTVVAAAAALQAVGSGWQAAVMAPTELLAEQHYRSFRHWLEPLGIECRWLAGRLGAAERRQVLEAMGSGQAGLVVGTHALFQEGVAFHRLAMAVIDEQHRFGVHQRLALTEKGGADGLKAHQLIMTATPIPRTLAMTTYADLDVSIIDELPPGRGEVATVAVPESRRDEVIARVREACAQSRQAYWVCPLIDESDTVEARAAEATAADLRESLPEITIGLVHGRMKADDKERVMAEFKAGEVQLLVATTVIEVGVDVPNASLMIIENAERMGLAQLHQLRGRVGRGSVDSTCLLMYRGPLSAGAKERLGVMRKTNDGFRIAQRDLELRGPGEVLGTRQTGLMQMRVANLMRDRDLLTPVRDVADRLLQEQPAHASLLISRWIGEASRYGQV